MRIQDLQRSLVIVHCISMWKCLWYFTNCRSNGYIASHVRVYLSVDKVLRCPQNDPSIWVFFWGTKIDMQVSHSTYVSVNGFFWVNR